MSPQGFHRAGFCTVLCNFEFVFSHFSLGPIYYLMMENDRYEDPPEGFFLGPPLEVVRPFFLIKLSNFSTTRPILDYENRARQDLKL